VQRDRASEGFKRLGKERGIRPGWEVGGEPCSGRARIPR